ncbi:hypothetical protein H8S33_06140 [Ornithinibacillus sp. BX22]|uniref:Glycosyl hydrolase n=1 Tax=Ornithinibacillus hominis TaxID=2763055 RepID=A0A923L4N5_9BACI|nr:glycosyl hydrolase family 8 [Ornithinibacillus hominis]MBC5636404.1 hypothetical protein [Ornithinibacillus hominis]
MKIIKLIIIIGIVLIGFIIVVKMVPSERFYPKEALSGERFVYEHLYEKNGLLKTDLSDQSDTYLSESIGLWMDYLVEKNDQEAFDEQFDVLTNHFMKESTLIPWLIKEDYLAPANALIDDLRIMKALYHAGEKWNNKTYLKTANKIGEALVQYNMQDETFINHVDLSSHVKGDFLTLSYLVPEALDEMHNQNIISENQYKVNRSILLNAPISEAGFFPQNYYPNDQRYEYDSEVNLIDQYYIGYHRALWGGDVSSLITFTKETLNQYDGKLFGRFSSETKQPTVQYEGTSVYALAILMCLEIGEKELARELYDRMKEYQIRDESSEYDGGYIELTSLKTHAFDNLLPLIAERKGIDEGVFE